MTRRPASLYSQCARFRGVTRILAIVSLLGLALLLYGCSSNRLTTNVGGSWEATLTGATGDGAALSFITTFTLNTDGTLNVTDFTFLNASQCFTAWSAPTGSAILTTSGTNQVTGPFTFSVSSEPASVNTLALTGNLTGTSNGTTTTTGSLSNGVVTGSWTLTGSQDCTGTTSSGGLAGSFLMCQGAATCSN